MKKGLVVLALVLCAVTAFAQVKVGPAVDKVIFDVRMDQNIALKDTVEGKTDIFFGEVPAVYFNKLSDADKAKLDVYTVPSLTFSLIMNPAPNKAPFTLEAEGKTQFNPFAIREFRYAMNWLIDRQKIVNEILMGAGFPMFTMGTPGQPGTYRYNLVASQLGMSARGNEKKAMTDMEAALNAAAALPANKGRLVKSGAWWTFDGQPVTIKFLIRVDDPTGRLLLGRYVSDQLEKVGIKVERQEFDRSKCINTVYGTDPKDGVWHMYTEAWGAGATRAYWAHIVAQMYAPYYGNMPGYSDPEMWNYTNAEIDTILEPIVNNSFLTEKDYWDGVLKAQKIGLEESVRIYISASEARFVANKARFASRFAYGLGDGPNEWSLRTADVKPETSGPNKGLKVLRVTQFSSRGSLFMFAWDPVGGDGFSDSYVAGIRGLVVDGGTFEAPNTALTTKLRAVFDEKKLQTSVALNAKGEIEGKLAVPATAVTYDSKSKTWKPVGSGVTAWTTGTSGYLWGKWHDGQSESMADMLYATAFAYEWSNKDGEGDKYYDEALSSIYLEALKLTKGQVWNYKGKTVQAWVDAQFPMEPARSAPALSVVAANPGYSAAVPWQVYEALAQMVAEGSKSGTTYTFQYSDDAAIVEVDLKVPSCVADIKAKLEELKAKKFIPAPLKGFITEAEAIARYDASIKFIDTYKHAFIGNGPFYINKIDTVANYVELTAFRDSYPYKSDYWAKAFRMQLSSIDSVTMPVGATRAKDAVITVKVSSYMYPDTAKTPLAKAKVTGALQMPDGSEKVYEAKAGAAGTFIVTIPAKDLGALKAGSYTVVVQSAIGTETPSVSPETLVLF